MYDAESARGKEREKERGTGASLLPSGSETELCELHNCNNSKTLVVKLEVTRVWYSVIYLVSWGKKVLNSKTLAL